MLKSLPIYCLHYYLPYELACLQGQTKALNASNHDQSNHVMDSDELLKFLYLNLVPILQKSLHPCPEHDPSCILRDNQLEIEPPIVNRKEDPGAFVHDLDTAESTSPLLHQAVATAVSNGAVVSEDYALLRTQLE